MDAGQPDRHLSRDDSPSSSSSSLDACPYIFGPGNPALQRDGQHHDASCERSHPSSMDISAFGSGRREHANEKMAAGKERLRTETVKTPVNLLNLPLDLLRCIVKEVTSTNDLIALAITHSVLHDLAVPHLYSRFDIVWPDGSTNVEPRAGVDALTYGLATLVMNEDVFSEVRPPTEAFTCSNCGHHNKPRRTSRRRQYNQKAKRKRGNDYAKHVRKFSLGNGPADWVQEYMVCKESGKMLGTLVALSIARMRNLEAFIWDMPTGILSEVWSALASLGEHNDGRECRLEKVWIRWPNHALLIDPLSPPLLPPPSPNHSTFHPNGNNDEDEGLNELAASMALLSTCPRRYDFPTFSMLSPLKSLNVLDIDELSYLDEMSLAIYNSRHRLRELRVGIARHASEREWVGAWEGGALQQLPKDDSLKAPAARRRSEKRLGGVLGVLVGHVYSIRQQRRRLSIPEAVIPSAALTSSSFSRPVCSLAHMNDQFAGAQGLTTLNLPSLSEPSLTASSDPTASISTSGTAAPAPLLSSNTPTRPTGSTSRPVGDASQKASSSENKTRVTASRHSEGSSSPDRSKHCTSGSSNNSSSSNINNAKGPYRNLNDDFPKTHQLRLELLELERVPLSMAALGGALDWSCLTELTLLDCANHDYLWRALRRQFAPSTTGISSKVYSSARANSRKSNSFFTETPRYSLRLRKIHTNTVTSSMLNCLRSALSPHTLETLVLQNSTEYVSKVSVDAIFKVIKFHARSLKQLYVNSCDRELEHADPRGWRRWMFNSEILRYVVSGKMHNLKELGFAVDSRNWHFLLQNLPSISHLRSLYIPFLAKPAMIPLGNLVPLPPAPPPLPIHLMPDNNAHGHDPNSIRALNNPTHAIQAPPPPPPLPPLPPVPPMPSLSHAQSSEAKELAMQIVDIVTLCPKIELTYLGIAEKCFEILELPVHRKSTTSYHEVAGARQSSQRREYEDYDQDGIFGRSDSSSAERIFMPSGVMFSYNGNEEEDDDEDEDDDDNDDDDEEEEEEEEEDDDSGSDDNMDDHDDEELSADFDSETNLDSELEDDPQDGDEEGRGDRGVDAGWRGAERSRTTGGESNAFDWVGAGARKRKTQFKLREILFYDDKVTVFKARHGRL